MTDTTRRKLTFSSKNSFQESLTYSVASSVSYHKLLYVSLKEKDETSVKKVIDNNSTDEV